MRWGVVAVSAACLIGSACVDRPPAAQPPLAVNTFSIDVSYIAPVSLPGFAYPFTNIDGTVTNTGSGPVHYTVHVEASSGETGTFVANSVLPGQTAVWVSRFLGDVTPADVKVTWETGYYNGPTPAVAAVTSVTPTQRPDIGAATEIKGTVTNTGMTAGNFSVELQASNGQVSWGAVANVPGQASATWTSVFYGSVTTVRIVRITPWVLVY
jgi:hypothetical protein